MDKITIGNEDYEVLTTDLESIKHITHARLAGGKVVDATCIDRLYIRVGVPRTPNACHVYYSDELEDNNIQPLKLLERMTVEFTGVVTQSWVSGDFATVTLSVSLNQFEDFPIDLYDGYKLTCSVIQVVD